ncbi:MAG: ribonuclease P protein component [Acholeplasmataceae bacterium]
MKRYYSLKNKKEIQNIFNHKKSSGNKYFSIYFKPHENKNFKFLISIGKKYGNAVKRNKIKRQIRMIIRENKDLISNNYSFVVVIKPTANTLKYHEIKELINYLLIKTKLRKTEEN